MITCTHPARCQDFVVHILESGFHMNSKREHSSPRVQIQDVWSYSRCMLMLPPLLYCWLATLYRKTPPLSSPYRGSASGSSLPLSKTCSVFHADRCSSLYWSSAPLRGPWRRPCTTMKLTTSYASPTIPAHHTALSRLCLWTSLLLPDRYLARSLPLRLLGRF